MCVDEDKVVTVAVMGQPNVGKSTLFNILTGRNVHVANWPGVTVEKHEGWREFRGYTLYFVDLPGIYGLSASTIEESIARDYLLHGRPDVVLVLVDSTIPERTMYLVIEVLELFPRTVVVFTKADLAHSRGVHINPDIIAGTLGVPVVMVSSATGYGVERLLETIIRVYEKGVSRKTGLRIDYGELEHYIGAVEEILRGTPVAKKYPVRWLAIRLLEGDIELTKRVEEVCGRDVVRQVLRVREEIISIFRRSPSELFAQKRFEYLHKLLSKAIARTREMVVHKTIDRVFLNPFYGPIASLSLLLLVFTIVFTLNTGFPLNIFFRAAGLHGVASSLEEYSLGSLMENFFSYIASVLDNVLSSQPLWVRSLVVEGIVGGVGAVLVFLPLVFLVSLFLAVLEDSGLAPRLAVSLHILFRRMGLSGHAVFPIVLSLGCNVPGVVATRAVPGFRERLRLLLTLAFIPCQARLVVVLAFASAISGFYGLLVVVLAYIVSFTVFVLVNKALELYDRRRGLWEEPELLLELPPVHKPLPKVVWWLTWDSTKHFIKKAGTIIFLLSILVWMLLHYSPSLEYVEDPSNSIGASIAALFSPLLYPLGLSGRQAWVIAFALLIGFIAKEAIIGTLSILSGGTDIAGILKSDLGLSDSQIASLTLFTILYVPCLATLAVVYTESRSLKITLAVIALMTIIAYTTSLLTYTIATLIT